MSRKSSFAPILLCLLPFAMSACGLKGGAGHDSGSVETCSGCHGSADNAAPPRGVHGETERSSLAVGAHQAHLHSTISAPIACSECHVVPTTRDQSGHLHTGPARVVFGTLATANGAIPSWDRKTATCSGTYCHGATLPGGSQITPLWNLVPQQSFTLSRGAERQSQCGTQCHGAMRENHLWREVRLCASCHPQSVDSKGALIPGGTHMNGIVDFQ